MEWIHNGVIWWREWAELPETRHLEGPSVLKENISDAVKNMKKEKSAGSEEISVEEL